MKDISITIHILVTSGCVLEETNTVLEIQTKNTPYCTNNSHIAGKTFVPDLTSQ